MNKRNETDEQRNARLTAFERDERTTTKRKTSDNGWQLNRIDNLEYEPDADGIYVLINWDVKTDTVRLDIMSRKHEPIQSFAGASDNVRKAAMRYLYEISRVNWPNSGYNISLEHAAYIGSELQSADIMRIDYIQDATITIGHKTDAELLEHYAKHNKAKAETILERYKQ